MRASQGHWSRQGQGGTLGLWIPGYAMLRIKVPVPAPQWDFGTSGAEGQEESSVDRSREGKKKNIDWRNWLQTFGKGRRRRAERGKTNNTQGCQRQSPEGCSILRLRDTTMAVTGHSQVTMSLPLRTSGLSKTQKVLCMVLSKCMICPRVLQHDGVALPPHFCPPPSTTLPLTLWPHPLAFAPSPLSFYLLLPMPCPLPSTTGPCSSVLFPSTSLSQPTSHA